MSARIRRATLMAGVVALALVASSPCWATVYNPIGKTMLLGYDGTQVQLATEGGTTRVWRWLDQAGSAQNAFHSVHSRRPALAQQDTGNGLHPAIDFDGADDFLRVNLANQSQPNTVFIVAARQTIVPGKASYMLDGQFSNRRHAVFLGADSVNQRMYAGATGAYSSVPATVGTWDLYAAQFNRTSSSLGLNGAQISSGNAGSHAAGNLNIGSRYSLGNANFDGYMAEFLFYPTSLTPQEVLRVESYLMNKYLRTYTGPGVTAGATVNFDAGYPGDNPRNAWASTTAMGELDFSFSGATAPTQVIFDLEPQMPLIGAAYGFDGGDVAKATSYRNLSTGDPWKDSATFELWVKPTDAAGQEILLELGGDVGSSLLLDGPDLLFVSNDETLIELRAQDVLTEVGLDHFIQLVGVIDKDLDEMRLYVNGQEVAAVADSVNRWTGADGTGLGGVNGKYGGAGLAGGQTPFDFSGYGGFDGQIAQYRFYELALSGDEVLGNYLAVVPEPTTLALVGLGLLSLARRRRR